MFLDGVTYAVLARNMAEGLGSFWSPFYTARVYPQFYEQPPLGLGLQALFFAIFGDHLAVERVYSLVMGGGTALLIVGLWRRTTRDTEHDWLPLLFWLLPSTVTWAIVNNMLENTQAVFTTAAVLMFVRALDASDRVRASLWSVVGGGLTLGAVLVKGPNGFFPLAAPVIAALLMPDRRRRALDSAVVCFLTVACGAIGLLIPEAPRGALTSYWNQHVSGALSGARGASRAEAALALARHLAGGIALRMGGLLALLATAGIPAAKSPDAGTRTARREVGRVLSGHGDRGIVTPPRQHENRGALPRAVDSVLRARLCDVPLRFIAPLQGFGDRRSTQLFLTGTGALLLVATAVVPLLNIRIEPRDLRWIAEYRRIGPSIPAGDIVGSCSAVATAWGLHAYLQRFYKLSLDTGSDRHRYFLRLTDRPCEAPPCPEAASSERLTLLDCSRQ